jgi:hypothetical protein
VTSPLACVLCALDPQAVNIAVPMVQASLIAAPILLRGQIAGGAKRVLRKARRAEPDPGSEPTADELIAPTGDDQRDGAT